jgi:5-methylcytosine-specific restriction enzyme A
LSDRWHRFSRATTKSKRWRGLRLEALRRDGFKCRQCGARGRLEVDHIKPERTHPELRFELSNLQCLCPSCHSKKTIAEIGRSVKSPGAQAWSIAITELSGSK